MAKTTEQPMSVDDLEDNEVEGGDTAAEAAEREPLQLEIKVESPSACQRHMTVTVSREDIDRYYDNAFSDLMPQAAVPGFRPGRAPRKLVESRFKKEVTDQIKSSLLMDSMAQVSEEQKLTAIGEPEFNFEAVEIPDEGPMTYEFDLEVRPEFDLPQWKGLTLERTSREFSEDDVEKEVQNLLARFGQLTPFDGAAEAGDYITANVTCKAGDEVVASSREATLRIRPVLSFHDARLEKFDKLMVGVKAGETRQAEVELTADAPNANLRGKKVTVSFEVLDVKRLQLPEFDQKFLTDLGFETEEEVRTAIRKKLERQLEYRNQQKARDQVTKLLTEAANWELPPGLLRRQSARELQRAVLELQRNGFSAEQIRAHENTLRQNSAASTARALKQHFILERIAEDEQLEAEPHDYDAEVALIASQSGESVRRVRAQLEKRGLMDTLRNQIIEHKVIGLVVENAKFKDVPYEQEEVDAEAIDLAAGGNEQEAVPPSAEATAS